MVKLWAKAKGINDPGQGTFNSYSLSLLVIFHLQNLSPPLLPPLSVLLQDLEDDMLNSERENVHIREEHLRRVVARMGEWVRSNHGSPAGPWEPFDLLFTFLWRLNQMFQNHPGTTSEELVVCTFEGRLIPRDNLIHLRDSLFYIEDPFSWKENTARTLHQYEVVEVIREHVEESLFVAAAAYGSADGGHMALSKLFHMKSKEGGVSKVHPWNHIHDAALHLEQHRTLKYFSEQLPDGRAVVLQPFWPLACGGGCKRFEGDALPMSSLNFWRSLLWPCDAVGVDWLDVETL